MTLKKLNEQIQKLVQPVNEESVKQLLPELKEVEFEFYGSITDEVGGQIDYEYGGLKGEHTVTESDNGYISLEQTDKGWQISCSWYTHYFAVSEKEIVNTVEEAQQFIIQLNDIFDEFEITDTFNESYYKALGQKGNTINELIDKIQNNTHFDVLHINENKLTVIDEWLGNTQEVISIEKV